MRWIMMRIKGLAMAGLAMSNGGRLTVCPMSLMRMAYPGCVPLILDQSAASTSRASTSTAIERLAGRRLAGDRGRLRSAGGKSGRPPHPPRGERRRRRLGIARALALAMAFP